MEGATIHLRDAGGTVRVELPVRNVVLATVEGRQSVGLARAMSDEIDAVIAREGAVHNFCDGWNQESHDPGIRHHWQEWAKARQPKLRSNQLLFRPKNTLATMAVTVANLMLGGSMTIHSTRAAFESALGAARASR